VASRRKINERPSGEIAGSASSARRGGFVTGGLVSGRFSPVSSEITNNPSGLSSPDVSVATTHVESGHHASEVGRKNANLG
jgi:hypothetical protein